MRSRSSGTRQRRRRARSSTSARIAASLVTFVNNSPNGVVASEVFDCYVGAERDVENRAGQESEIPNFKGSYLGRFPLVSADFWTSDHLSERSRSVGAVFETRARGTLTLKRR